MLLLVVGSYTEAYGPFRAEGEGLALVAMRSDGTLALLDRLTGLRNPAYLRVDRSRDLCHAALETDDGHADIAAVAIDPQARRLHLTRMSRLAGSILCHLDVHPGGRWIAGACYGSGHVFTRPLDAQGIAAADGGASVRRRGNSVHPVRQTTAHPHAARFSPDGRWLVVPDLGMDEVACYAFDAETGALATPARVSPAAAGSGPRLALFSQDGRHLILVHELKCSVASFAWEDGNLRPVAMRSALFAPHDGANTTAGLRWHPSGRAFAVSNRGADRIAVFHFEPATGMIEPWCEHASGGTKPRDFEFTPCGNWLIAGNQDSDRLAVLAVSLDDPRLRDTGLGLHLRSPSCIRIAGDEQPDR